MTPAEQANHRAAEYRESRSWNGLIALQRRKRIETATVQAEQRILELLEQDPDRYYDGDWKQAVRDLADWRSRDPHDEAQWRIAA
jgi:hypothetical protein